MTEWKKVQLKEVLKQYRNTHWVEDKEYRQVTISQTGTVSYRGTNHGSTIGRKRQFLIDLKDHPNTLIFIRQGVQKGGIGLCPPEVDGCIVTENMPMFEVIDVKPEYLNFYLKSPLFKEDIQKLVPLGTAQKAIHERQLLELEMPLPNITEQEKIISQIKRLNNSNNSLQELLASNESLISSLRQLILQEAVQGMLGYADTKSFKEYLLGEVIQFTKNGYTGRPNEMNVGMPRLGIETVTQSKFASINTNMVKYINISEDEKKNYFVKDKDVLICRQNGNLNYVGKAAVYTGEEDRFIFSDSLIQIRLKLNLINPFFLVIFLNSVVARKQLDDFCSTTAGNYSINGANLRKVKFLLPSLTEQKRIVEKVDKLMAYCDELEKQVKESQENSEKLMEAVLRESFE